MKLRKALLILAALAELGGLWWLVVHPLFLVPLAGAYWLGLKGVTPRNLRHLRREVRWPRRGRTPRRT